MVGRLLSTAPALAVGLLLARRTLNCRELRAATRDLTLAAGRLRTPGSGVSTGQAANALSLLTAVA